MNISANQIDALKELVNIGVGRAAGVLNQMVSAHIKLQVPQVQIITLRDLTEETKNIGTDMLATVQIHFKGLFSGNAAMVMAPDSAAKLVSVLTNEEIGTADLDTVRAGTLAEVGNIVINGVMGAIVNILNQQLTFSLPDFTEDRIENLFRSKHNDSNTTVMSARTRLLIEQLQIKSDIIIFFEMDSFDMLLSAIENAASAVCSNINGSCEGCG
jgi:chemotaxis protein CheC